MILSLDADFLAARSRPACATRASLRDKRRVDGEQAEMNRLYAVESMPTNTGAMADHRLPLRASEVEDFARALAAEIGHAGAALRADSTRMRSGSRRWRATWCATAARAW